MRRLRRIRSRVEDFTDAVREHPATSFALGAVVCGVIATGTSLGAIHYDGRETAEAAASARAAAASTTAQNHHDYTTGYLEGRVATTDEAEALAASNNEQTNIEVDAAASFLCLVSATGLAISSLRRFGGY